MAKRGRPLKTTSPRDITPEDRRIRLVKVMKDRGYAPEHAAKAMHVKLGLVKAWFEGRYDGISERKLKKLETALDAIPPETWECRKKGPAPDAELFDKAPEEILAFAEELKKIAGEIPPEEASNPLRYLARKYSGAIFAQALHLMLAAKSASVRADMVKFLTERGFGRPAAAIETGEEKPGMNEDEFVETLRRKVDEARLKAEKVAAAEAKVQASFSKKTKDDDEKPTATH